MNRSELRPGDYLEPRCLLCDEAYDKTPEIRPVPQQRIIEKMNEYMGRRDYAGAERHLLYWLEEAVLGKDLRGQLMLRNELAGHYRKVNDREKAVENAEEALRLLQELDFEGTISSGTTCVNAATVFNAFGENERSLALFRRAKDIYESAERTDPSLLGGLYNNMALTCAALGQYEEAFSLFEKALRVMDGVAAGELEQAITCLNMADTIEKQEGMEAGEQKINDLLDRAFALLQTETVPRNGYCAFVFEKCAPAFSYYGLFLAAKELEKQAEEIYHAGT